ncbi:MAG: YraN family protein [Anaerolineales bacterium]|nr:YraN family protein [Anaerolineales bacterium]
MTGTKKRLARGASPSPQTVGLAEKGYQIIARNVRTPYGEIDIIAQQADVTIFVEVKNTDLKQGFLSREKITPAKQNI